MSTCARVGGAPTLELKNWGPQAQNQCGAPVGGANGRPGPPELIDSSPVSALKEFVARAPKLQPKPHHFGVLLIKTPL